MVLEGRDGQIAFTQKSRPDVEAVYAGHSVFGFTCSLTAAQLTGTDASFQFQLHGISLADLRLSVTPETVELVKALQQARAAKRQWCRDHARCPSCTYSQPAFSAGSIRCPRSSTVFPQQGEAMNFLTPELYRASSLQDAANISMNHSYNMTRQGLVNLFPDMINMQHVVPDSGLPIFALHCILSHYAADLHTEARENFLSLTIKDLISRPPDEWSSN